MNKQITNIIEDSIKTKQLILNDNAIIEKIKQAVAEIATAFSSNGKLLLAGNGGSASDSQHIAAEFVVRLYGNRPAYPAMALTTDISILTAIGNDFGFNCLFERQLQAHAQQGDIFLAISTSGNSENIIKALEYCKKHNIRTIGFSGKGGGKMESLCDICITVPADDTARVQESHILIGHIICLLVEQTMAK